jgi:hypothetical protein
LTNKDILSGTFFYADFPGFDSFPDPSSLVSPFTLKRDDKKPHAGDFLHTDYQFEPDK